MAFACVIGFLSLRRYDPDQVRRVTAPHYGQSAMPTISQPLL